MTVARRPGRQPEITAELRPRSVDLRDLASLIAGGPGPSGTPGQTPQQHAQATRTTAYGERRALRRPIQLRRSRTLPLGTTARVANTETGRSVTVEVEDRGPFVRDRILDVSPRTAEELGMKRDGTARVEKASVEVPQRDGGTKPGAGAAGSGGPGQEQGR